MPATNASVVICGAGIAGISAAYHLAVGHELRDVWLVDERPPLSLTSDKSSECYRNWWPGPGDEMVALMNRSIDLMEGLAHSSDNVIGLNRRGYLYVTADAGRIEHLAQAGEEAAALGAGPLRCHGGSPASATYQPAPASGFADQPTGADLITDQALIHRHFPYLTERAGAVLHVRRAGWLSGQQLGALMLEQARAHGVRLVRARLTGVDLLAGRVDVVRLHDGAVESSVRTECLVDAAGPYCSDVARLLGVELPLAAELHAKVTFLDQRVAVPRQAPLLIWNDPQRLPWSDDERAALAESPDTTWLLDELPAGAHTRPEGAPGGAAAMMLWPYHTSPVPVAWPPAFDPQYPEIVLRGLAAMLPALGQYASRLPRMSVDGGYYMVTPDNRPLIGPLPTPGAYVLGGLSGFGVMAACAAGELLAGHVAGAVLPHYAPAFRLDRYADPAYQALLASRPATWQL